MKKFEINLQEFRKRESTYCPFSFVVGYYEWGHAFILFFYWFLIFNQK
jgi:hypothetical protein